MRQDSVSPLMGAQDAISPPICGAVLERDRDGDPATRFSRDKFYYYNIFNRRHDRLSSLGGASRRPAQARHAR
jgi:hypothetical protein